MIIIHEVGHQYWYGLLGSNEFEEAWLDEGINSYTEMRIMDDAYGFGSFIGFPGVEVNSSDYQRLGYTKRNPILDTFGHVCGAWTHGNWAGFGQSGRFHCLIGAHASRRWRSACLKRPQILATDTPDRVPTGVHAAQMRLDPSPLRWVETWLWPMFARDPPTDHNDGEQRLVGGAR